MKYLVLALVTLSTCSAFAKDKLVCSFTEPFFNITFDANTGAVTYVGAENYDQATGSFIPKELSAKAILKENAAITSGQDYILVDAATGATLLDLTMDGQGSDGMSDLLFVFSATYGSNIGGCYTDTAPAIDTIKVLEELNLEISL